MNKYILSKDRLENVVEIVVVPWKTRTEITLKLKRRLREGNVMS